MLTRKQFGVLALLIVVSPVFGVYLADLVGYHEPLDVAADLLGLKDITEKINWTPFLDYSVPGLPDWLGYIIAGFIGMAAVLAVGWLIQKYL